MEDHRTRKQAEFGEGEDTAASAGVGVNPEDDPEHALALRVHKEEQMTRRQAECGGEDDIAALPHLLMIVWRKGRKEQDHIW